MQEIVMSDRCKQNPRLPPHEIALGGWFSSCAGTAPLSGTAESWRSVFGGFGRLPPILSPHYGGVLSADWEEQNTKTFADQKKISCGFIIAVAPVFACLFVSWFYAWWRRKAFLTKYFNLHFAFSLKHNKKNKRSNDLYSSHLQDFFRVTFLT